MQIEIPNKFLHDLLAQILRIERNYAHELTGVKTQRRTDIKNLINKAVAEKLEKP